MTYVTSVERIGIKKGLEQGIQQGEQFLLRRLLTQRFGLLPAWAEEKLAHAERSDIERWAGRVLEASSLQEIFGE